MFQIGTSQNIIRDISTRLSFCQKSLKMLAQFILCFLFLHDCVALTMIAIRPHQQSNSCETTKHEDPLREEALLFLDDVSPSLACKHVYHVYTKMCMAFLGKIILKKSLNA